MVKQAPMEGGVAKGLGLYSATSIKGQDLNHAGDRGNPGIDGVCVCWGLVSFIPFPTPELNLYVS